MNATRIPRVPVELLALRTAVTTFLSIIAVADQWAEQAADVNRIAAPEYAALLDQLRDELKAAGNDHETGTPARIAVAVAELLGDDGR